MDYPKAKIPTDPVLSLAAFGTRAGTHVPSVTDVRHVAQVTSGRMAIGLALQAMGLAAGDEVLLPAYHSRSMVEPLVWLRAVPVFYRVLASTAVDLDDVARRIGPRSRVLVAVHYFGFPQDLPLLRRFCDHHGLLLLEDCAHAFFGQHAGCALGSFGDYAIASSMKFFPVYDGGCLVSSRHDLGHLRLRSAGIKFELKTAFNTFERAFAWGRLPALALLLSLPLRVKDRIWGSLKARATGTACSAGAAGSLVPVGPRASDGGFGFEAAWLDKKPSLVSRLLLATVSVARIAAVRRATYLRLQQACSDLPGCRPLYSVLPDGVVPWVFPLLVDDPATLFPALKHARIPVVRFGEFLWDGVDATTCPVSAALSRGVMQFPVHQELRESEIDWMIGAIRTIMRATARREMLRTGAAA